MNQREAATIVGTLCAANPGWKATEATVALWVEMLADLPYDVATVATRRLIATTTDWPSIALVRRAVADELGLLPPPVDVACRQFIARASGNLPGDMHEAVTAAVDAMGGWRNVRQASNVSVLVGQFRALYADVAQRTTAQVSADPVGLLEGPPMPELTA